MKQGTYFKKLSQIRRAGFAGNQQGQAVIEYVLLLVVTVSLVLGFRGVFSSMNNFMSDFMGEYVVCLMEYGELPALGVQEADLKQHKDGGAGRKCEFRKYSAAFVASSGSGGSGGSGGTSGPGNGKTGGGGKSGSNPTKGSDGSNKSANSDASKSGNESSSGSDLASKRSAGRASPYTTGQISNSGSYSAADAPGSAADKKIKILEDETGKGRNAAATDSSRSNQRRVGYQNGKYKAITGGMAEQIEKNSKLRPRKPSSNLLASDEGGYRFVPHKKTFTPPERKPDLVEPPDEGFQFGNFLKWLIIAGIVIAGFVLFGGQVLNYSNSDS